jgi:hypothetical protein
MFGIIQGAENAATTGTFGNGADSLPDARANPHEWIFNTSLDVYGKDAGLHLHRVTGYPESSCYAYVARDGTKRRRPPEHFGRAIIHQSDDQRFFDAFMAGCTSPWWIEFQRNAELGRQVRALIE